MSIDAMTTNPSASNVVNLGSPAHQHAQDLLPWFVMNTLDAADRAAVEEHLHDCGACQQEMQWQQQLREANRTPLPERDVDRAFAALRARMPAPRDTERFAATRRSAIASPTNWLGSLRDAWRSLSAPASWAFALQTVLIVALTGVLMSGTVRWPAKAGADSSLFHALARPAATVPPARLVIAFAPQTSVAQMRRMLLASGARIVDGPTAADAYVLAVPPDHVDASLQSLRAEPSVLLIQSLDAKEAH